MPYLLNEDGVIVQDADGVSWTEVVKQKNAASANAARVAAMYQELDAVEEAAEEVIEVVKEQKSELVRIEIGKEHDHLIASLSERLDAMAQRESETQMALVAALQQIGLRDPVVNVSAPNVDVNVEQPAITVEQPAITIEPPEVTVQSPSVSVNPEIHLPSSSKTITFERDFDGRVTKADVVEGGEVS